MSCSSETIVLKANLEVARSLVVLYCLRYRATDSHGVTLVIIIPVINCLEVIRPLTLISLLQSKVVLSEMLRCLTVISGVVDALSLWDEFLLSFRGIVYLILVAKLDVGRLHV